MGKQRQKKNHGQSRPASVNSVDWETRALELVRQGLCSSLILDYPTNLNRKNER